MSVVWNGKRLDWFHPSRGICLGDPIFPYLFVLCMEKLGHVTGGGVEVGRWKSIQLTRLGPKLWHLFFANDLILFVQASVDQIKVVLEYLEQFCTVTGQKVSL